MRAWYEVQEHDTNVVLQWRAVKGFREEITSTIKRAADEAGAYMATHVPFHSGQMYHAIYVTPVTYKPGGAGGGGTYEAEVGLEASLAPHAEWVIEGTGIYNRTSPSKGIFTGTYNGVFRFEKDFGEVVYTPVVHGMKPQRAWFEDAQELAQNIIDHAVRHGV